MQSNIAIRENITLNTEILNHDSKFQQKDTACLEPATDMEIFISQFSSTKVSAPKKCILRQELRYLVPGTSEPTFYSKSKS